MGGQNPIEDPFLCGVVSKGQSRRGYGLQKKVHYRDFSVINFAKCIENLPSLDFVMDFKYTVFQLTLPETKHKKGHTT